MFWTLALSAAFTLLALSPLVLPGGAPLEHLPPPLAGMEKIGRIVTSEIAAPVVRKVVGGDANEPETVVAAPAVPDLATGGGEVLGTAAGGDAGGSAVPPADVDAGPPAPDREPDEAECRGRCGGEGVARPVAPEDPRAETSGHGRANGHETARGEGHAKENGEGHAKYDDEAESAEPAVTAGTKAKPKAEKTGAGKAKTNADATPKANGKGKAKDDTKAKSKGNGKGDGKGESGGGSNQGKGNHPAKGKG
jgi:hypothetical protein